MKKFSLNSILLLALYKWSRLLGYTEIFNLLWEAAKKFF